MTELSVRATLGANDAAQEPNPAAALRALIGLAVTSIALLALYLVKVGWTATWPSQAVGVILSAIAVLGSAAALLVQRGQASRGAWLGIASVCAACIALAALAAELGIPLAVSLPLFVSILALTTLPRERFASAFLVAVISSGAILLLDAYGAARPASLPGGLIVVVVLDGLLLAVAGFIVARQFGDYTLRAKLILSFLLVSLVPIVLLAYLDSRSTRAALINEADQKLFSAASQLATSLDTFFETNLAHVETEAQLEAFQRYLTLQPELRHGHEYEVSAADTLGVLAGRDPAGITSYALLDPQGNNLLDTDEEQMGVAESGRDYVDVPAASGRPYASHVQLAALSGEPSLFFAAPIYGEQGRLLGLLRIRYQASVLQRILVQNAGLAGPDSFAVLFDEDEIHLAHSTAPETILKAVGPLSEDEARALIRAHRLPDLPADELSTHLPDLVAKLNAVTPDDPYFEAEDVATGSRTNQVAVALMSAQPWSVAYFQPQDILFAPVNEQARSVLGIAVLIAGIAALVAISLSQVLSRPILRLTGIAMRLAEGDLDARVPADTGDEIGALARTFNGMAEHLRALVTGLEERVAERTQDLERRARQLQAAAEVSKGAGAIRDAGRLLDEAVRLITERFGYYHAGVFLIDDDGEFAILRAASSEGGQVMLARGHALPVGKLGLIGYVTGTGKARVASDVGSDSVYYANPDLPHTRSELALPLAIGDRVIGALDVQSVEPNAFDDSDVVILQTMADQLAIAIENARLLERQTRVAGQRRQAIDLYRNLTQELGYDQLLSELSKRIRQTFAYSRVIMALVEGEELVVRSSDADERLKPTRIGERMTFGQGLLGRAVTLRAPATWPAEGVRPTRTEPPTGPVPQTALAVPLISRGSVIGALSVEKRDGEGLNEDDLELVELLASQVAVSLENARLFEETERSLRQLDGLFRQQAAEAWSQLLARREEEGGEASYVAGRADIISTIEGESKNIETPIALRGEVIGKLNVEGLGTGEWTEEELMILEAVAGEVADQLEQIRLLQEIRRRATHMETAAEIARAATGVLDEKALLQRAAGLIHERFQYDHVAVYLLEGEGEPPRLAESIGSDADGLAELLSGGEGPVPAVVREVARTGAAVVSRGADGSPHADPAKAEPTSEAGIPLKIGDRVLGALYAVQRSAAAFDEEETAVLEVLTDQLAVALQNARLFQETLGRAEREQAVVQISGLIRASGDIDGMLRTAVRELRERIGAKVARVQLVQSPYEPTAGTGPIGAGRGTGALETNHHTETNGRPRADEEAEGEP